MLKKSTAGVIIIAIILAIITTIGGTTITIPTAPITASAQFFPGPPGPPGKNGTQGLMKRYHFVEVLLLIVFKSI
jgi:hypothetical protein